MRYTLYVGDSEKVYPMIFSRGVAATSDRSALSIANDSSVELDGVRIFPGYSGKLPPGELARVIRLDRPEISVEVSA